MSTGEQPLDKFGRPVEVFGPDANCTLELCPIEWSVYEYQPSIPASSIFIALFGISMVVHAYLGWRWKSWFFMWCMILGGVFEIIGYVGRILLHNNPFSFVAFLIQIICITSAPVFYCAAIYVTIGKSVASFDPSISRIPPFLYYWIFIVCDVVSLALQASGGALSSVSDGKSEVGVQVAMAGLGFQVATIVLFCALFGDYCFRYIRREKCAGRSVSTRVKIFLTFLTLAILIILARCSFRVKELEEGYEGELIHEETLFIALEGALIVIAVYCLCIGHPGLVFTQSRLDTVLKSEYDSGESGPGLSNGSKCCQRR